MKTVSTRLPGRAAEGTVTIHNHLPAGHRWQALLDQVFHAALHEVPGAWDVSVHPIDRLWFQIEVIAPDGASWSMSSSTQDGPRIEDLAETIRAACVRRSRARPAKAKRGDGAASNGPKPAAAKGLSK